MLAGKISDTMYVARGRDRILALGREGGCGHWVECIPYIISKLMAWGRRGVYKGVLKMLIFL